MENFLKAGFPGASRRPLVFHLGDGTSTRLSCTEQTQPDQTADRQTLVTTSSDPASPSGQLFDQRLAEVPPSDCRKKASAEELLTIHTAVLQVVALGGNCSQQRHQQRALSLSQSSRLNASIMSKYFLRWGRMSSGKAFKMRPPRTSNAVSRLERTFCSIDRTRPFGPHGPSNIGLLP